MKLNNKLEIQHERGIHVIHKVPSTKLSPKLDHIQ